MRMRQIWTLLLCLITQTFLSDSEILTIDIDFNDGVDSDGNSNGILRFEGQGGFQVFFTDDGSKPDAGGVEITNTNPGNIKVGSTTDFVLGAVDSLHSSGIRATFNMGADLVSFFDTDDDSTKKSLFAFNAAGELIGQSQPNSQVGVRVDQSMTGGRKIFAVEFDTLAGTAGGFADGTYFTIDDFHAEGVDTTTITSPPDSPCKICKDEEVLVGCTTSFEGTCRGPCSDSLCPAGQYHAQDQPGQECSDQGCRPECSQSGTDQNPIVAEISSPSCGECVGPAPFRTNVTLTGELAQSYVYKWRIRQAEKETAEVHTFVQETISILIDPVTLNMTAGTEYILDVLIHDPPKPKAEKYLASTRFTFCLQPRLHFTI